MYTESAFKKGNCSVMSKREDPIGIVLIYWVVVKKPGEGLTETSQERSSGRDGLYA